MYALCQNDVIIETISINFLLEAIMARTAKSADGAKTSTLSVRLTPKMRFGLEIMARLHRDTVPEIVTRAINDVFSSEFEGLWDYEGPEESGSKRPLLNLLWAEEPSDRLVNIALYSPNLLSTVERRIWMKIKNDPKFWNNPQELTLASLRRDFLAECWEAMQSE